MTSLSSSTSVTTAVDTAGPRSMYRFAGWGAVLAAGCYLLQPLYVTFAAEEEEWISPATIEQAVWRGPLEAAVFVGVGVGLLVVVVGLDRLVSARVSDPGWRVAHLLGVVSAIGWLLMGGLAVGGSSTVARAMGDIGADLPTMQVGMQAVLIVVTGALGLVATTFAGWLIGLARWGRRADVIGRPTAIVAVVAAIACVVPQLVWSQPFGALVAVPALVFIGVALLRRGS